MNAHHGKGLVISSNSACGRDLRPSGCLLIMIFGNDLTRAEQIALKARLLAKHHQDVFSAMPNTMTAGDEVLAMVRQHLKTYHNACMATSDSGVHPLDMAARLIPEDLLLLAPFQDVAVNDTDATKWHLVAASLCFPAHWVLAEKMGKPLAAIHDPVPHYDERLAAPVDRFFNKMTVGPISSRMNWSLQIGKDLFTPHRAARKAVSGDMTMTNYVCVSKTRPCVNCPKRGLCFLRSERISNRSHAGTISPMRLTIWRKC